MVTFSSVVPNKATTVQMNPEANVRISDSIIKIYDNDDLNATASSGNGTAGNPWIIENRSIDVGGAPDDGILISGTTDYFIVQNCTIVNAGSGRDGIKLLSVMNGIIRNNTLKSSTTGNGFNIQNCRGLQIYDNIIQNMTQGEGIYLVNTNETSISENKITNTQYGLYISQSHNNRLFHNVIRDITSAGINFYTLSNFNNCTLQYNVISNCSIGIKGTRMTNSMFCYNTIYQNTEDGIQLKTNCHNITISHNIITENKYGITTNAENTTLINNSVKNNDLYGIYFTAGNFHKVIRNNVSLNNDTGIYLSGADNSIIHNNTINNNLNYGIRLTGGALNNNVTCNIIHNNGICWLDMGSGTVFLDNDCFPEENGGGGIPGFQLPILLLAIIVAIYLIVAISRNWNFKQLF